MTDVVARLRSALADRYAVECELGQGGMATVYLATDLRHERAVALKVLRPELAAALGAERFLREIKTTAQLAHPHILPLLDSGEADGTLFYVMPFVEGESLRDRLEREKQLPLGEALQVAREVADALSYAHSRGVVHRDIKPENVLLESGHAVVADFGIARAIGAAGGGRLTETGLAVGTPAYMSPEQAAGGRDVDGRADLYSLGCVLYEMLAGQPPFAGMTPDSVMRQHMAAAPPSITVIRPAVPAAIAAALDQALAKTPADRFATAAKFAEALDVRASAAGGPLPLASDLQTTPRRRRGRRLLAPAIAAVVIVAAAAAVLRWLWPGLAAGGQRQVALAILPFENLSPEGPNGRLADALHIEIVAQLSRVPALSVRPRAAVLKYAHTDKALREIGRDLEVARLVTGSVQVEGNGLRVNVELLDPATGSALWGNQYNRTVDDAFAVQSEIAQRLVEMVGGALTRAETGALGTAPTRNSAAYRLFLLGEEQRLRTCCDRRVFLGARQLLEQAVALDSEFALAHASLSMLYGWLQVNNFIASAEGMARQREEAEIALRLAPGLPQAHVAMGQVHYYASTATRQDMRRALREYQAAAAAAPGAAEVWDELSRVYAALGDWEAFQGSIDRAAALDPRNAFRSLTRALTLWGRHRYEQAAAAYDEWMALASPSDLASGRLSERAMLYAVWRGELDSLRAVAALRGCRALPGCADEGCLASRCCAQLALFERRPDSLLAIFPDPRPIVYDGYEVYEPALLYVAWAHGLRGDSAMARRAFAEALAQLDSVSRRLPGDPRIHAARGLVLAGLGRRADAKREADWLLAPADSLELDFSQYYRTSAALILAQARFTDEAIAVLEQLLRGFSRLVSGPMLRLDPLWDPIRGDPRFRALVRQYGG